MRKEGNGGRKSEEIPSQENQKEIKDDIIEKLRKPKKVEGVKSKINKGSNRDERGQGRKEREEDNKRRRQGRVGDRGKIIRKKK